jgi:hypothetical protein
LGCWTRSGLSGHLDLAGYAAAEPIVRERHGANPFRPVQAGLYYNFEAALI